MSYIITGFIFYVIGCVFGAKAYVFLFPPKPTKSKELEIKQLVFRWITDKRNLIITHIVEGDRTLWREEDPYTIETFDEIKERRLAEAKILIEKFKQL